MWALVVFDGSRVEFPPELHYRTGCATARCAGWIRTLSAGRDSVVRQHGVSEWIVGFRQVLVTPVRRPRRSQCWIGATWEEGRYLAEPVSLMTNLSEVASWVQRETHSLAVIGHDADRIVCSHRPASSRYGVAIRVKAHRCSLTQISLSAPPRKASVPTALRPAQHRVL